MPDARVARRYADALIEVAADQGAVDPVGADLKSLIALMDQFDGMLRSALCTPVFSADERSAVLGELLPKLSLHPLSANFLRLLSDKGRMDAIDEIAAEYATLADGRAGRVTVRVTTAEPMSAAVEKDVKEALSKATGMQVVLAPKVDPALIGGMVVHVGGKVYDSSIRTRLQGVRRALLSAQAPAVAK